MQRICRPPQNIVELTVSEDNLVFLAMNSIAHRRECRFSLYQATLSSF